MYKNKRTGIIGILITIIVLIILVLLTNIKTGSITGIESAFSKIVMPIQNGLTYLKNKISGNDAFFQDINNLKAENEALREENSKLQESLRELEIIKAENATLREYNNMSEKYSEYRAVPAYIINKDISNLSDTMVINAGSNDGIKENMPVITNEGLVGYVLSTTNKTSKIQPIIDPATSVSASISTSRDGVMVKGILGSDNTLKLMYIPTDADIVLEDTIETSGIVGIYPNGILIWKISQIIESKNITDRYAIVETAVDFSKLETVLVITE